MPQVAFDFYVIKFYPRRATFAEAVGSLHSHYPFGFQHLPRIPSFGQIRIPPARVPQSFNVIRFLQNVHYQPVTLVKGLQDQADFRQLNPLKSGQSKSFVVDAAKLWNPSGIALERGRIYDVKAEADQTWNGTY